MIEGFLNRQTPLSELSSNVAPIPIDPFFMEGQPTPVSTGVEMPLSFEVVLPRTTEDVNLIYQNGFYPMVRQTDYYYTLDGLTATTGDTITFLFASADQTTPEIEEIFEGNSAVQVAANWSSQEPILKPGFMKGHTVMDAGNNIPIITRTGSIESTIDAMQADGSNWFAYDYYWAYEETTAPIIIDESTVDPYAMDQETLVEMANMVHERGMKFLLITELEWIVMPEERELAGETIDEWMEYNGKKWSEGQAYATEMGEKLDQNPDDPEVQAYWDRWFDQFTPFMLHAAKLAEENDIEALALGKQLAGAMSPNNAQRWSSLIQKVRQVYSGQITQVLFTNQYSDWTKLPWLSDLDFITIYYYNNISEKEQPTQTELIASFENFNRVQFDPLFELTNKPIVFLNVFQSRDHAAKQEWFEPMASCPENVSQDWIAQADLYEAFFNATIDEEWFNGMLTWGYWVTPHFQSEYCFESSSSVRSKPANLVVRSWFDRIDDAESSP
jgi:hypothetical protein